MRVVVFHEPSYEPHSRFLYTLALGIDANFRLKQKKRGIQDIRLGDGRAYCVPKTMFDNALKANENVTEVR